MRCCQCVLSLSALLTWGCDYFAHVSGRVSSCDDHRPLESSLVLADLGGMQVGIPVNDKGGFRGGVNAPEGARLHVTISSPRYVTLEVPRWDTTLPHEVCLRPRPGG